MAIAAIEMAVSLQYLKPQTKKAFATRQKNIGAQHTLLLCADADF